MQGLMQDWPLLVSSILEHANINHPEQQIVIALGRGADPPLHLRATCTSAASAAPRR